MQLHFLALKEIKSIKKKTFEILTYDLKIQITLRILKNIYTSSCVIGIHILKMHHNKI